MATYLLPLTSSYLTHLHALASKKKTLFTLAVPSLPSLARSMAKQPACQSAGEMRPKLGGKRRCSYPARTHTHTLRSRSFLFVRFSWPALSLSARRLGSISLPSQVQLQQFGGNMMCMDDGRALLAYLSRYAFFSNKVQCYAQRWAPRRASRACRVRFFASASDAVKRETAVTPHAAGPSL